MQFSRTSKPVVLVHVVTFNHCDCIETCLRSVIAQEGFSPWKDLLIFVTDNASSDGTAELVTEKFIGEVRIRRNITNLGFTGAHNLGAELAKECGADYLLVLNPDVRLEKDAVARMVDALEFDSRAGTCCPKLYRADEKLEPSHPLRFDSTGMYITPSFRHFDRGSDEPEQHQFDEAQYVFGSSGACMLMRRDFLEDVQLETPQDHTGLDLFDNAFFAYREDADLAWRAQWLGWKCRYEPMAVGYHRRVVLPERRAELPPELNAYGVRNRFLLQFNNASLLANWSNLPFAFWRNLLVVAGVLIRERSSLPALSAAIQLAPRALRRRRLLFKKRRVQPHVVGEWFSFLPRAYPALPVPSGNRDLIRELTVAVVDYQSGSRLERCLKSVVDAAEELKDRLNIKIVTVDNDEESSRFTETDGNSFPSVIFEQPAHNLGFAGAINHSCTRHVADAFLILNPDICIDATSLSKAIDAMEQHPKIGALSPVLRGSDAVLQIAYLARTFPTVGSTLAELFLLHRLIPRNPWTARHIPRRDRFVIRYLEQASSPEGTPTERLDQPLVVDQPAGACLLIRRAAFERIGGFDAKFWPAWFEDVDFCRRLRAAGYLSAVVGCAGVVHEGGYSSEKLGRRRFSEIWYSNLLRYWRKHGTPLEYAAIRTFLPIALAIRSSAFYVQTLLTKKEKVAERAETRELAKTLLRLAGVYALPTGSQDVLDGELPASQDS